MSDSQYGILYKITTFGESHAKALGVIIDGIPANFPLDLEKVQRQLDRRRPGQSKVSTTRNEADQLQVLSGFFEGKTTGTPLTIIVENGDQHPNDYSNIQNFYRPNHGDFTYHQKYGFRDHRGGGRASGRETLARVIAGAVAQQFLDKLGIKITAFTKSIGNIVCKNYDAAQIDENSVRTADAKTAQEMVQLIEMIKKEDNSIGGTIECNIEGVPAGLGEPVFDKLDGELGKAMLSLGTVKGIEFGDGFLVSTRKGSENNDLHTAQGYLTNHGGGIEAGISNGNTIHFRLAIKPTPSIALVQKMVDTKGEEMDIQIRGRHDPCICPRIVPVVEAMAAVVLFDFYLRQQARVSFPLS